MSEAPLKPPPEGKREARARLIATPIILAVLGGILAIQVWTGSSTGTRILIALFGAAAGAEMALLFKAAGRPAAPREAAVLCGLICLGGIIGDPLSMMSDQALLLAAAVIVVLARHLFDTRPEAIDSIATRLIPIIFVGFLFSFMAWCAWDVGFLVWLVLTAKASDMAGWAIGVPFGKHKMVPTVSPGKSWEGTIAGVLASILVAVLLPLVIDMPWDPPWLVLAGAGLVIGAASVFAGVLWSAWKRRLGAKDSSALIPAMGGVMDMVDSLLLAAPAAQAYLSIYHRLTWPP